VSARDDFLVAFCPYCAVPCPTYTRTDLRILPHKRYSNFAESLGTCSGSDVVMPAIECGENEDPRFDPVPILLDAEGKLRP